jgi:hypothetical protein
MFAKNKRTLGRMRSGHVWFSPIMLAIVRGSAKMWRIEMMWKVITACVIMHNMIVEKDHDDSLL